MIINLSSGKKVKEYTDMLRVKDAVNFYTCLRYMVQDYLMQDITLNIPVDTWLTGYKAPFFDQVASGDFFQGNDKDLISKISPLNNEFNDDIQNSEMRIDTGTLDQSRICRIRQINEKPYLNILRNIYNGATYI